MTPSENQPIYFYQNEIPDCCPSNWVQRMFENDIIRWQFAVEACENATQILESPNFEDPADWLLNGATIENNVAKMPFNNSLIAQQNIPGLVLGNWYEITVTVQKVSLNASGSKLRIFGFDGQFQFSASVGTFTFYGQASSTAISLTHLFNVEISLENELEVSFFGVKEMTYPIATIKNLSGVILAQVTDVVPGGNFATFEFAPNQATIDAGTFYIEVDRDCVGSAEVWKSENICVIPPNDCDLYIGACANTNVWGEDFQPLIRLEGELKGGVGYSYDRTMNETNTGQHNLIYGRRNKMWSIAFDLVPEYVRDFLYYLAMSNTIAVKVGTGDPYQYFITEEPDEPSYPAGEKHLASVSMRLVRKKRLEETLFAAQCDVSLPPVVIGDENKDAIADENQNLINA